MFSVNEETGSVMVCVNLQGVREVTVTVTLVVDEDPQLPGNQRATSKTHPTYLKDYDIFLFILKGGSDFEMREEMIIFNPTVTQICESIIVNNDTLSEDVEEFLVLLRPESPRVTVNNSARVLILDTDSKHLAHFLHSDSACSFSKRCRHQL